MKYYRVTDEFNRNPIYFRVDNDLVEGLVVNEPPTWVSLSGVITDEADLLDLYTAQSPNENVSIVEITEEEVGV